MHPVLFHNSLCDIHTYGALVAFGLLAGYFRMQYSARKLGDDPDRIADVALWVLICGFLGARLLYVVVRFDEKYRHDPIGVFKIWEGGLVLYGGIITALLVGLWLIRKKGMNFHRSADITMPCVMLGLTFGRWGCLMSGCCFGQKAPDLPWAITFPAIEGSMVPGDFQGTPLHPTQIYMSLNALAIFVILTLVLRRRRFEGQVFYLSLILYSISRSIIECFRGDNEERGYFGPLSTSQWISLVVVLFALWRYVACWKKAPAPAPAPPPPAGTAVSGGNGPARGAGPRKTS
jgi:phosphatidylglycerol---prolipoprotein diacylglyceryl transferase